MKRPLLLIVFTAAIALADEVTNWNLVATQALSAAQTDDLNQTRVLAIAHIAIHDALNSIERRYDPYLYERSTGSGPIAAVAVASAAHTALVALIPGQKQAIDAALQRSLMTVLDSPQKTSGVQLGQASAQAILARRANDGAQATGAARIGTLPGEYRPIPPELFPPFAPHWSQVTPFAMRSAVAFRARPPPDLNSLEWVGNYNEVKAIGSEGSAVRTPEQSEIAKFWYEVSATGWNRIARTVAETRSSATLWDNARLFACSTQRSPIRT